MNDSFSKIEITNSQPPDLAGSEPAPPGKEERNAARPRDRIEIPHELLDGEDFHLPRPPLLRPTLHFAGIVLNEPVGDGVLHDRFEECIRVGLLRRGAGQAGLPGCDHVGSNLRNAQVAEGREHIEPKQALIQGSGSRSKAAPTD